MYWCNTSCNDECLEFCVVYVNSAIGKKNYMYLICIEMKSILYLVLPTIWTYAML